jgi:hypothetical protein
MANTELDASIASDVETLALPAILAGAVERV